MFRGYTILRSNFLVAASALIISLSLAGCSQAPAENVIPPIPTETPYTPEELALYKEAFDGLTIERDDVEGDTTYLLSPRFLNSAFVPIIFQQDNSAPELVIRLRYLGESWIFWDSYVIAIDDERLTQDVAYSDVFRDAGSGRVIEAYNMTDSRLGGNETTLDITGKISKANSVTVRLKGDYDYDYVFVEDDFQRAQIFSDAFKWIRWNYDQNNE